MLNSLLDATHTSLMYMTINLKNKKIAINHPMIYVDMAMDDDDSRARRLRAGKKQAAGDDGLEDWFGDLALEGDEQHMDDATGKNRDDRKRDVAGDSEPNQSVPMVLEK